ncbi:hypothetical protein A2U01_0068744, partial [Trifolium medium]|nr:hypothetical protein [Trifolium medium]
MYLNPRVHGLILTKGKNSTSEGGGEDREVTLPGPPKMGPWAVTARAFGLLPP